MQKINALSTRHEFYWLGFNLSDEEVSGYIEAENHLLARALLHKQGINIAYINKTSRLLSNHKMTSRDKSQFMNQLATLVKASLSLNQALMIMHKGQTKLTMKALIDAIRRDLKQGLGLSECLQKHKMIFSPIIIKLIHAGELAGKLDLMLSQIAAYTDRLDSIKNKTRKALIYPLAILITALFVSAGLLLFVVPEFDGLFKSFHAELPLFTQFIICLSRHFPIFCLNGLFGGIALLAGFRFLLNKYSQFQKTIDRLILQLPLAGKLIRQSMTARFARTLAISYSANLPILESLGAVKEIMGNLIYAQGISTLQMALQKGEALDKAINDTGLFSTTVVQMISVGEESGSLDTMLVKLAEIYEDDLNNRVDSLTKLIEPIIIILLAILIGGLIVALYLPIFQLGSF